MREWGKCRQSQRSLARLTCTDMMEYRFVAVPVPTLNKHLESESTSLAKDITDLEKKLHYQETTYKNSRQHIEKMLQTGARP